MIVVDKVVPMERNGAPCRHRSRAGGRGRNELAGGAETAATRGLAVEGTALYCVDGYEYVAGVIIDMTPSFRVSWA